MLLTFEFLFLDIESIQYDNVHQVVNTEWNTQMLVMEWPAPDVLGGAAFPEEN